MGVGGGEGKCVGVWGEVRGDVGRGVGGSELRCVWMGEGRGVRGRMHECVGVWGRCGERCGAVRWGIRRGDGRCGEVWG